MTRLATVLIAIAGLINFAPLIGVASAERLAALYGVAIEDPLLIFLMRHRAVLLAIVGGLLLTSTFRRALRPAATAAGFCSMISFVVLAWLADGLNAQLSRVVAVDLFAIACLAVAWAIDRRAPADSTPS